MCGIFGFVATHNSAYDIASLKPLLDYFMILSESRGKDASGLALISREKIQVLKRPIRGRCLIRLEEYRALLKDYVLEAEMSSERHEPLLAAIGHARMVTNGGEETHENNQPVHKNGLICLHNGIVINDLQIWNQFPHLQRKYEVDTEVILSLIEHYRGQGLSVVDAVVRMFEQCKGGNSIALFSEDVNGLVIATTNGSLYFAIGAENQELVFASERYILGKILRHTSLKRLFDCTVINHVEPNVGYAFSFDDLRPHVFTLKGDLHVVDLPPKKPHRRLHDEQPSGTKPYVSMAAPLRLAQLEKLLSVDERAIASLKRCTRCLLPETFPFIEYDAQGICTYCHNHRPYSPKGRERLEELVAPFRRSDGMPDCIVPLSGGRDSCYSLHYIKNVLHLHPVAYTYDWGMVTDLARRNISRMCGALGIEHILISADIKQKRENIRKNVLAWLHNPVVGMVPMFMAGDKQIFYYSNLLKKQMGLDIVLFGMNPLERTDFKTALCNIDENYPKEIHYNLSITNKLRLVFYYSKQFLQNPAYINSSLLDTAFAYFSYYCIPRDYYIVYDFVRWNEEVITNVLMAEYDWEVASDTPTRWRIGDGTASFYNYIYLKMVGFTENDTYRSNLVREGMMTRDEALKIIREENYPRFESIKWYCDTIGVDYPSTIEVINRAPRAY